MITVTIRPSNLQFPSSSSPDRPSRSRPVGITGSLEAGSWVPGTHVHEAGQQPHPLHATATGESFPFVTLRPPPFFPGLDHDSFMKTQREMGLLRVLLGKSYFVFLTTFLSSAAEGP